MTTLSLKTLSTATKRLASSGAKYNAAMQEHLVNIVTFINDPAYNGEANATTGNGNVSPATELVNSITRKVDREAIIAWFQKHGGMKWRGALKDKAGNVTKPAAFKRDASADFKFDVEAAKASMWYADKVNAAKDENAPRTTKYDAPARLKSLIEAIAKASKGPKVEGDELPEGMLEALDEVFKKYSADRSSAIPAKEEPKAENTNAPTPAPVKQTA